MFLVGRNNNEFREGHVILIVRSESTACGVTWDKMFPASCSKKSIHEEMTYSSATERLKDMLEKISLDASKFFLHKLRSEGASAALRTERKPVCLVQ